MTGSWVPSAILFVVTAWWLFGAIALLGIQEPLKPAWLRAFALDTVLLFAVILAYGWVAG